MKKPVTLPENVTKPNIKFNTYYDRPITEKPMFFDPNSSLTDQDFRMQTDINYLLAHMAGHSRTPIYGVQDNSTFEDWSNEMALVKRRFMHLDAETRGMFGNAQNFLNWCADPKNYEGELPSKLRSISEQQDLENQQKYQDDKENRLAGKIAKAIKGE